jgi:23S rRNA (adenine2503-C2)-methyltransferase
MAEARCAGGLKVGLAAAWRRGRLLGSPPMRSLDDLRTACRAAGARPAHERRLLQAFVRGTPLAAAGANPAVPFPQTLRAALPALAAATAGLATVATEHPGADGSARLLVRLADGQTVETVLLPNAGVCVSTQVGCAVGCLFCMTGRDGLLRQLGSAEIVAQVALARARRAVRRVVFMGMGEPAHNLDAVLEAIDLLGTEGGLGHKELVFSTVGDRRVFERLPRGRVKPALALSLHTTDPALRRRLLPRAPAIEPAELVELGEAYARATTYPIQYQWTLLAGVNDGDDEVEAVARLLAGKYAVLNFIPYNTVDGSGFRRPDWEHAIRLARRLHARGVLTKLRRSAGQDVDGGCGQLRSRREAGGAGGEARAPGLDVGELRG